MLDPNLINEPPAPMAARKRLPHKIRFTAAEWTRVIDRARETGRPPARYVREAALGATPRVRRSQANAPLIRELGRIGNALVGIAHMSSDTKAGAALEQVLTELLDAVRRLT